VLFKLLVKKDSSFTT